MKSISEYRLSKIGVDAAPKLPFYPMRLIKTISLPFEEGETKLTLYYPEAPDEAKLSVYFNFHGGGFVLGFSENDDFLCRYIAYKACLVVINVDYCLAPEYKFPRGIISSYKAIQWLVANAEEYHLDVNSMAIGGQSAGGNFAAALSILARDREDFRFVKQVIAYGLLDLSEPIEEKNCKMEPNLPKSLTVKRMNQYMRWYFSDYLAESKNIMASPLLCENLENLPASLIITAEFDQLKFEGKEYARRLNESGVKARLVEFTHCGHGFSHQKDAQLVQVFSDLIVHELGVLHRHLQVP